MLFTPDGPALWCPVYKYFEYICYLHRTVRREGPIKFSLRRRIDVRRLNFLIENYAGLYTGRVVGSYVVDLLDLNGTTSSNGKSDFYKTELELKYGFWNFNFFLDW